MAKFEFDNNLANMIKNIENLSNKEEIYIEMISSGQDIMKKAIQSGANKHRTNRDVKHMADSLKCTKPIKNKDGIWVGRVKFYGSNGVYKTKDGKKYDITNWLKAFRIEYGRSNQKAEPFVRPAIQSCKKNINDKWNKIYERELDDLK